MDQSANPVLIGDGDIATTHIVARLMREAFGTVEIVYPQTLQRAHLRDRLIVISRLCLPELSWLPRYLQQARIKYTYFLDDNFYEIDVKHDRHNGTYFGHPEVRATLDLFLTCAERAVVMSPALALYLQARFPEVSVCRIVPPIDLALIDQLRGVTKANTGGKLRIGYPSTRRANVADLVTNAVKRVLAKHRDTVEFEFMGWMPDGLQEYGGVTFLPEVQGYEAYVAKVLSRGWAMAIAPLRDSPFENCKTNLKFREYGAFGIPGIYSAVPLYSTCVDSGQTGLLTQNHEVDWTQAIELLVTHPELRMKIARNARAHIETHYAQPIAAEQLRAHLTRKASAA